jgi:hypothetical protein
MEQTHSSRYNSRFCSVPRNAWDLAFDYEENMQVSAESFRWEQDVDTAFRQVFTSFV